MPSQALPYDLRLGAGTLDLCKFVTAFAVQPPPWRATGPRSSWSERPIHCLDRARESSGAAGVRHLCFLACRIRIERLLSNFDECGTPIEA